MKIFPATAVKEIDAFTIEHEPIVSIDLMERAARRLTEWYVRKFHIDKEIVIFAGPGNNGGDALAMARMLAERQYRVSCYHVLPAKKISKDCGINLERLHEAGMAKYYELRTMADFPELRSKEIVVDGIFGSGLSRPAEGLFAEVIRQINDSNCKVISIDIPSGLFGENNAENKRENIVCADLTLTFQFPFLSFFFAENYDFTGEWKVLDIGLHPGIIDKTPCSYTAQDLDSFRSTLTLRQPFTHKGSFGHALVIAGSYGMMGAAILSVEAALRAGAGLVTAHIPKNGYFIIQTAVPEAIVSIDRSEILFSEAPDLEQYSSVAIGPGIGTKPNTVRGLSELIHRCRIPMVLDADALNILGEHRDLIAELPEHTILTPHPREFDRMAETSPDAFSRHLKQIEFSKKYRLIVVLKGAFTGISFPDGSYCFNMSGNPGMATGGSGDVLTGIIVSLLAQGLEPGEAALKAVFLHGLAGDISAEELGEEAMLAGDITRHLGRAYKKLKE